jgi:hypothetical protein
MKTELETAQETIARLMVALHDAINRPKGVVPVSAEEFYNPLRYNSDNWD